MLFHYMNVFFDYYVYKLKHYYWIIYRKFAIFATRNQYVTLV